LLYLSESNAGADEVRLDLPKGQLAGFLGTIPETFSRILTRTVKQGLITADGPRIRIMDRQGLSDLAEGITRL